jgi:hypothetical protein
MYIVFSVFQKDTTRYQNEIEFWKDRAVLAESQAKSVRKFADSVLVESKKADSVANKQTGRINTLISNAKKQRQVNNVTLTKLTQTLPDTCKSALELARNYRGEADSLHVALDAAQVRDSIRKVDSDRLREGMNRLMTSNDSLRNVIKSVPIYKKPKILGFIPQPSKKVIFVAGVAVGSVGTFYLHRR